MKNVFVLAVASLIATSANAAEMKWSGSAGWRYEQSKVDSSLNGPTAVNRTKTDSLRANLGVSGGWENVEWGAGLRTQNRNGALANDDHVTLQNATDLGVGFEQAWFRYVRDFGSLDFSATVGRQKNVFAYDNISQNLFDNDVRFDGLGWQFKFGMFGLNLGQYVLGAQNGVANRAGASSVTNNDTTDATAGLNQKFNYLFGFQPHMNWKFSDDIEAMFAVGYYIWKDNGQTNALPNAGALTNSAFRMENARQWQFTASVSLPYNLAFNGEYVMNRKQNYDLNTVGVIPTVLGTSADRSAWSLGLTYGSLKKARDFSVGYAYGSKGLASVDSAYTYEKFAPDNKGHTIDVAYAIADNFNVGAKALFLTQKSSTDPVTGVDYAGAAKGQQTKTNYWELTAGVMF